MTNFRFAPSSDETVDLTAASRGLLASLCLLGFASMPNSTWLVLPAVGVLAHTIHTLGALRRPVSWPHAWRFVRRWSLRVLGGVGAFTAAGQLSDGPGVLAIMGSLIFLVGLVIVGVVVASALVRAATAATPRIATIAATAIEDVRFQLRLAWLSIAP